MFEYRLKQATNIAPFIASASININMAHVTPRVRTLAKKIIASRQLDKYARSQSGILAYAVYLEFAPEGLPVAFHNNLLNSTMSPDWLSRMADLVRADEALSRMRHMYGRGMTVEEVVERRMRSIEDHGQLPWMTRDVRPQRNELIKEALSLGAERDAEITAMMCEPLNSKRLVFTVNI
jgi:hypothetical protein